MKSSNSTTAAITGLIAAAFAAGHAAALPQVLYLVEVDNSTNLAGADTGFEHSWLTFDLYVDLEPGDIVFAADFGIAGSNTGIITDGAFYVAPAFASDSVADNVGFAALVGDLEYSSAVTINGGDVEFAQAMDWNPAGVTGAWFVNPGQTGAGGPYGAEDMWVARITVSNDARLLYGQMFVSGDGPNGAFGVSGANIPLGVVNLPIPTPGAVSLLAIAGAAATRRRR